MRWHHDVLPRAVTHAASISVCVPFALSLHITISLSVSLLLSLSMCPHLVSLESFWIFFCLLELLVMVQVLSDYLSFYLFQVSGSISIFAPPHALSLTLSFSLARSLSRSFTYLRDISE